MVSKSRNHTVRAKVIRKYTCDAREGKQKYQRLMFLDEKGLMMKAVLFGHNVDYFDEIITDDQCYDMSNLVLSPVATGFQSYPDKKQIYINTSSSIKKVDKGESSSHFTSKLSKFRRFQATLFRTMLRSAVVLSLWNELALACEIFGDKDLCGAVISLTSLQIREFKGFAITTNYFSKINFNPTEGRADELRKWFEANRDTILTTTGITRLKKEPRTTNMPISTIEHASGLKAIDITPEDVVKIAAYVPDFTVDCLLLTVSCNICAKVCDVPPEASYLCDNCHNYTTIVAKMFVDFITIAGTGTLKLATNSRIAEQLLKIKSSDLYNMPDKDCASFVDKASTALRNKKTKMLLSPVESFLTNHNKLVWWLKDIL